MLWELVATHDLVLVCGLGCLEHGCSMAGSWKMARTFFKFFLGRQTFFKGSVNAFILLPTNIFWKDCPDFYLTTKSNEKLNQFK
jgi:hypothetical protein